jgi:hypothetical protein
MPSSLDSALSERDSRLRALKRKAGHVFMLDAFHRQFPGAPGPATADRARRGPRAPNSHRDS